MSILYKIERKKWDILPYLLIFIVTIFATHLLFRNGICTGDDFRYHIPMILDDYYSLKSLKYEGISNVLISGIGVGKRLFYSPLPHLSVASFYLIFENIGFTLIQSLKFVIFLSVYISSIFVYKLSLKMTGNRFAAIIGAVIYTLYPYRLLDIFGRFAFAEVFSFIFLPLFFMGLYDFVHLDRKDFSIKPFLELLFGGALLFLTHNITAFYTFIFGIIYLLFNIKKIVDILKARMVVVYTSITIVLLIGLIAVNMFTQLELLNMNYYNISDSERMWTNLSIAEECTSRYIRYSGFFDFYSFGDEINFHKIIGTTITFSFSTITYFIIDYKLKEYKKINKFYHFISIPIYILLVYMFSYRVEIIMAAWLVVGIHKLLLIYNNEAINKNINKNITFIYLLVIIFIVFLLISCLKVWEYLPQIFFKIQFSWRLWAFFQLFISLIGAYLIGYYGNKKSILCLVILGIGLLLVGNKTIYQKRVANENQTGWCYEIDDTVFNSQYSIGFNQEYLPTIYYRGENTNYKSQYKNSLYSKIYAELNSNKERKQYSIKPVALISLDQADSGNTEIFVKYVDVPKYELVINADSKATIQMPLLYYPGYEAIAINKATNEITKLYIKDIDSLISFDIDEGTYEVIINFEGTTARQIGSTYFGLSVFGTFVFILYDYYYHRKKDSQKELI